MHLKKKTFSEFLHSVILDPCEHEIIFNPKPRFDEFPKKHKGIKQKDLLPEIKKVLNTDNPVQIGGVCIRKDATGNCVTHTFVIAGYKTVCPESKKACPKDKKNCSESDYRTLVKVHTSWGEEWQKEYNGGWVDAESIIKNINDNPEVGRGILSWLK